ncbi:hypothetical protein M1145_02745 [Patescibacteria group bacterium]|nr:hypothetical protein [Patescibacteria group bacterium]
MENKWNKNILKKKNLLVLIAIGISTTFIIFSVKVSFAKEVPPWLRGYPLNLYVQSIVNGSGSGGVGVITGNGGTGAPPSSCNKALFTNGGNCHLSKGLLTLYGKVGSLMKIPPAFLAAEKHQESGANCLFNETNSGNTTANAISLMSIIDHSLNYHSTGPYQFEPATWSGYATQTWSIIKQNFPYAISAGESQNILLDSMIGASLYFAQNDSGGSPPHPTVGGISSSNTWTNLQLLNAAVHFNAGGGSPNYPYDSGYAKSGVYHLYLAYQSVCKFP